MRDNGLIGRILVVQGSTAESPSVRRLQRLLDTYVETLPVSTNEIAGTDTEKWRQIMSEAAEIFRRDFAEIGVVPLVDFVIERKRKGGRPRVDKPESVKRAEAVERARASKERREAAGRVEVRYYVSPETRERADALIAERGLSGMSALIEELVNEATKGTSS